ncbi:ABC transporter permease [Gottfriedia solisilvae]|uniref:ABC transporter permease n=1 Tax=Gottfriedia solisilvae TaxID=1516104 RepID=A0A8J3AKB3_9BACI|nr:ABC transporter permease [Gottfriedia solisilvae]GGI15098.1 ABC transporter permease [Gottfriedia solisilvae]
MRTVKQLWSSRYKSYLKEISKYGRYIFNDHIKFVLVFGFGGGAYYYQQLLKTISLDYPAVLFISIVFALLVSSGQITTYFKGPDLYYLLPLEKRMKGYFIRSYFITFLVQAYLLLMFLGVIYPIYKKFMLGETTSFIVFIIIIFLLKAYHLFVSFLHTSNKGILNRGLDYCVRAIGSFFFIYALLSKWNIFLLFIPIICLAVYAILIQTISQNKRVQWERNVKLDTSRLASFYRFANLFTDVPSIQQQVRRRRWADPIIKKIKTNNAADYLLVRTFIRNGNYLSMFIRQLFVGAFVVYLVPTVIGKLIIGILFLYMIGIQNMAILKQYNYHMLWRIYPYTNDENKKSISTLLYILLLICSVVFSVIALVKGMAALNFLLMIFIYMVFSVWFIKFYVSKRLSQSQKL